MGRRDELDAIVGEAARGQHSSWRGGEEEWRLLVRRDAELAARSASLSRKLAGDTGNHLSPSLRTLCESYDAPVLLATGASTEVAEVIKRHTAKLSINDNERVAAAIDHYEPHIDFDKLLE